MKRILFLTTAHQFDDDRIFFHQAKTLVKKGFSVKICSLSSEYHGILDGIDVESYQAIHLSIQEKKKILQDVCFSFQPDSIICSEPLAVIAARKFTKKHHAAIIYDVTEWYPSFRMIASYSFLGKLFHAFKFFFIQCYAGWLSSRFIFGEYSKRFPLYYFFPFKKSILLPYFPDEEYIDENRNAFSPNKIKLCYTGNFTVDKGIVNFLNAADSFRKRRPEIKISLLLIGAPPSENNQKFFNYLLQKYDFDDVEIKKPVLFKNFTSSFSDADICFDLRKKNFENNHCLPIKIFYYAASGKPVIYTNLKATRAFVDVCEFGYLVHPEDPEEIGDCIETYINNPNLYNKHSQNAKILYTKKYNWKIIEDSFVNFIKDSVHK